jgi:dihydroorotate dehydrogenase
MGLYESVLRQLLFRMDPEVVHTRAFRLLRSGLVRAKTFQHPMLEQELFGVRFPNPLGLAAGFDKDGVALDHWHRLGFGFVEAGTITYHFQPGNSKPRLFRLPKDRGLVNRLGFNNEGAEAAAGRIAKAKPRIPLGINLGKSKITPLEEASSDYASSFGLLHGLGSYFVVNVSSPNTPGLRELQDKGPLVQILNALRDVDATRPIFVKVSPDLSPTALDDVISVAHELKLTGLIATNTTISREGLREAAPTEGGLSGAPLRQRANEVLSQLASSCDSSMILIGAGGIFDGRDLFDKIACGAHLAQVYTGWIYGGPSMVPRALRELVGLMEQEGMKTLADLRLSRMLT